jgi:Flp pilus assembly protein TadD
MLPPALVLTNKNCGGNRLLYSLAMLACLVVMGCTPPGPRALLKGKNLVDEGKFDLAVKPLEQATVLLPKNAYSWNYLGLAYHGNHQPDEAIKAYRTALSLDHKLSAVRYNLGCLYLEQTNVTAAIDELKSFTLLQPVAVEGWLKLGGAQLQARRLDDAERSFLAAIELQARNPVALNGLGLVQVQRRRWAEAANCFNGAALQQPPYGPALLNSAVVQHQYLNNRAVALQRYREYLAIQPRPADWQGVEVTMRQLERELNPVPVVHASSPGSRTVQPVRSNSIVQPVIAARAPATLTVARTNRAATNVPVKSAPATTTLPKSNAPVTIARTPLETPRTPTPTLPATNRSVEASPSVAKPSEIEVSQVPSEVIVKPAEALASPVPKAAPAGSSRTASAETTNDTNHSRRSLLSRLNPFSGKNRSDAKENRLQTDPSRRAGSDAALSAVRYSYLSPLAPTPGNRLDAEKAFKRGLQKQKDGEQTAALTEYRSAVRSDPAYYDAYYNLGLAAMVKGETGLALWAYELALALKPDSADARYNFALALKAGGYWHDAADQLKKIVSGNAADARGHLALANLYSQQLQQGDLARAHYLQVLDLNPRHPEASKIRYWLAANP